MKRIQGLLLSAAGYTVLILTAFYIFASVSGFTESKIGFPMFMLILLFGVLISAAGMLFKIESLKKSVSLIIHYTSLMVMFCVIFIGSGNISSKGAAGIFVAVIIFTVFYALIFAITYFTRKGIELLDGKLDNKLEKNRGKKNNGTSKTTGYKPLYK